MSERKVLQKYYPPDFDPSDISRRKGPKSTGPRVQTVRLMAPFSMRCMTCGEFIAKARKFNARKTTPLEEKYLGIQIFYFSIRCTRCSTEIIFRTDPKSTDYSMVKGAVRNLEPWRNKIAEEETTEERLDRLEQEEAAAAGEEEKNAMADLEAKNLDARREMAAADALDEIRQRNARINRSEKDGVDYSDSIVRTEDEEQARQEKEDDDAAKRAFAEARAQLDVVVEDEDWSQDITRSDTASASSSSTGMAGSAASAPMADSEMPPPSFKRVPKKKKNYSAMLGIKKKPSLV
ncbi:cell cycle control protein cwf16 [Dactylonectria estremocensis]|uniref:Splicing factor YJU2 n=1 Tax=Dactylonectria estremocensis TaxID=1079267 RepID=A0A9P9F590_9HYPO|nr:cell cycle control protein cwf16 [Dactylonectria estremocensis]